MKEKIDRQIHKQKKYINEHQHKTEKKIFTNNSIQRNTKH